MAVYTVSNLTGVTADGATLADAATWFNTLTPEALASTGDHSILLLGGVYSDNDTEFIVSSRLDTSNFRSLKIYAIAGATLKNNSGFRAIRIANLNPQGFQAVDIYGLNILGYQYAITVPGINQAAYRFYNCTVNTDLIETGRADMVGFDSCTITSTLTTTDNALISGIGYKLSNCNFFNSSDVQPFQSSILAIQHPTYYRDSEIILNVDSLQFQQDNFNLKGHFNISNCAFKVVDNSFSRAQINALSYVSIVDLIALNSLIVTEGFTFQFTPDEVVFQTIAVDTFNYPISKSESQILNRHIGANRYAITQTVPIANADYTNVLGVYESNKVSPTPLVYELEVPRAGFARTATLHFTRSGNTEQLGTDGEVEILIERSTDGTNFTTLGTFLSGIDASTLDFDFLNAPAKAIRASIQPVGAAFGEIQIEGITVDFKTLEDRLSQTDERTLYTAGNIPANVSELYNRAIHDPIANFTQAVEANQLMLSPSGGLENVDENGIMNATFEGDSVFTELTYAYWIYIPSDFIPVNDHYTSGNWNADVAPNALGITIGLRNITSNLGWRVIAANGDYTVLNYDLIPDAQFLAKYAGKFRYIAATFKNGIVKFYIDAVNVLTFTNTSSTVKFPADGVFSVNGTNNKTGRGFVEGFKSDAHYLSLTKAYTSAEIAELRATDQFNNEHLR